MAAAAVYLAGRGSHLRCSHWSRHDANLRAARHKAGNAELVALSILPDLGMLLGAFAAGVITKMLPAGATPAETEAIDPKLEAAGFGVLVPFFFVNTGIAFDLDALAPQGERRWRQTAGPRQMPPSTRDDGRSPYPRRVTRSPSDSVR